MKKILIKSQQPYFSFCYRFNTSVCCTYWHEEGVNFVTYSWYRLLPLWQQMIQTGTEKKKVKNLWQFKDAVRYATVLCHTQGGK